MHVISDDDYEFLLAAKARQEKEAAYRRARAQRPAVKLREAQRRAERRDAERLNAKLFGMIQRGMLALDNEPEVPVAEGGEAAE